MNATNLEEEVVDMETSQIQAKISEWAARQQAHSRKFRSR